MHVLRNTLSLRPLWLPACLLLAGAALLALPAGTAGERAVYVLEIEGAIGPATRDYVVRGLEQAEQAGASLVVLRMDTPGGLDASMRDIIRKILNAEVPVATWVAPSGARAASAGTYILYASHVAAMAPSTHLGAATPVPVGGGRPATPPERAREALDEDTDEPVPGAPGDAGAKALEDAVAYIRGLAQRHGRNAEWAERAVRESVSLTASEALAENVTDMLATSIPDLLAQADGREVMVAGASVVLALQDARIETIEPDWRSRLLAVITNPMLAYGLLMVGIYGLMLEGYNPGSLVPGVIGGICLLLALYAFQILPVNYAGVALVILGLLLILAELFVPSFGILGIGGVTAVIFGSIIMMDSDVPGFGISPGVAAAMGAGAALLFFGVMYLVVRSHRQPRVSRVDNVIGSTAEALDDFRNGRGRVHMGGEDWSARARQPVSAGNRVRVRAIDGLTLEVEPLTPSGD